MKISDIFYSIQGESGYSGLPCVFIRFSGCNLRCRYCDTTSAFYEGYDATVEEVIKAVSNYHVNLIELTGGEPLLQAEAGILAQRLAETGFQVLVETNGSQNIDVLPSPVVRIMDIKCPGSGESQNMDWNNISRLREQDEVKFVISDRADFEWAVSIIDKYNLYFVNSILISPVFSVLEPDKLARWILETKKPIRLHLQLHKIISVK